ncbi:MAG TPA: NADH-ubiquinone oxidoreductase-F iron-sulfur binding region domain-containing protein [Jatrophihabitans sp.]|nr:NADH-ubiquinone oxidoreductase-F iron-sulfur binding region domain-containing protein [Jatrophihabitans sp.]
MTSHLHAVPALEPSGAALLAHPLHYFGPGGAMTELTADSFRDHRVRYGPLAPASGDLIGLLETTGLAGRGGAHVPAALKWRAVESAVHPDGPVVVANGAESEPDSRKDTALLEYRPHLVLDGLLAAATSIGARTAVVWLHEGASAARSATARALAERPRNDWEDVDVRVEIGPAGYLTGESGAIVRALSGGPALPEFRRWPTAVSGVGGRPTLVHNVETLARVALLARGFAPSTTLLTVVSGEVHSVVEASEEAELTDVVAGITRTAPVAALVGGYGGRWVTWAELSGAVLSEPALRARGLSLGAGVISVLGPGACGLARAAVIADYLAGQSARQCGPCVFGLRAAADSLALLVRGGWRSRRETARLETFLAEIDGRGACGHPDGAVQMVSSALRAFAGDVAAHRRGRCAAREGAR